MHQLKAMAFCQPVNTSTLDPEVLHQLFENKLCQDSVFEEIDERQIKRDEDKND